ncbi:MAG: WG repeat-containing protein, partial [Muribaculaceae bacterium]|nr:WG repeat-containing protein [Muribaculaceae bacterium]
VIDRTNKAVIDFKWDDIKPFDMEKSEICWVKTDNGWRGLEILSQNYAFDGAYVDAYNFNDAGYAYVSDALGMFGCIDRKGNTVIPMRMGHISLIEKCLTEMGENGKTSISDIEAYRFNLNNHPMRNGFRLSHTIGNDMWEY